MDIPFTFVAGEQVLPAGAYWVTVDPDFRLCRFDNLSSSSMQMILLSRYFDRRPFTKAAHGTLRFTRYGSQHFLSNVWRPGQEDGNRVPVSKRLLEAAKSQVNGAGPAVSEVSTPIS